MPASAGEVQRCRIGSRGQRVLHAVREQGIERAAPVGDDLRVCALRGVAGRSGPVYQLVVFARVQVSGVVGDLIGPAQQAGRLVGYRIAARDEAQCFGRVLLRVCRTPAGPCVTGPSRTRRPAVALPGAARTPAPSRRVAFGRIPHGDDRGEGQDDGSSLPLGKHDRESTVPAVTVARPDSVAGWAGNFRR